MATVIQLYTQLGKMRGVNFGEARHLARTLQAAELLPRAHRYQLRQPPEVTSKDCATFLIGRAASRISGSRTPIVLRRRVKAFKQLVTQEPDGKVRNLFDDLVALIDHHRDTAWVTDKTREWAPGKLVFINDEKSPEVWIEYGNLAHGDPDGNPLIRRVSYAPKRLLDRDMNDIDFDRDEYCADAYMISAGVFFRLRKLLGPLKPKESAG